MKVERIRKAYEQVADQLMTMINSGELKPGDRLPSEAELAADFGVSRTTVREALRILATRNLIHTRKGMAGGHFIVEPTVGSISEFLVESAKSSIKPASVFAVTLATECKSPGASSRTRQRFTAMISPHSPTSLLKSVPLPARFLA